MFSVDSDLKIFYRNSDEDSIKIWKEFFNNQIPILSEQAKQFDHNMLQLYQNTSRLLALLWKKLFAKSLFEFAQGAVGLLLGMLLVVVAWSPLIYLVLALIACRIGLEVLKAACQGSILLLNFYVRIFPPPSLFPAEQLKKDTEILTSLQQQFFLNIEYPTVDTDFLNSILKVQNFFTHSKNISEMNEEKIAAKVQKMFPEHSEQYQKKVRDSFGKKRKEREKALRVMAQSIYDKTKMPLFKSWDKFFLKEKERKEEKEEKEGYATWDAFRQNYQYNLQSAQLLQCEPMPTFKEFFIQNIKTLPLKVEEQGKPLFFEESLDYHKIGFIKNFAEYAIKECQSLFEFEFDEERDTLWVDSIFIEYLYRRPPENPQPLNQYWDQKLLDCLQALENKSPQIKLEGIAECAASYKNSSRENTSVTRKR